MRSKWVPSDDVRHVLAALTPPNRLACEVALRTGLRIGDVLQIKKEQLFSPRLNIQEQKTGKRRRVTLPSELRDRLLSQSGPIYVFSGRCNARKPRSRQAVWKDLRRAATLFRCPGVTPHSLRKCYAVDKLHSGKSLSDVQRLLNHDDPAVTAIYALADVLTKRRGS